MRIVSGIAGHHNTDMIKAFTKGDKSVCINSLDSNFQAQLLQTVSAFKPDFCFLQVQRPNIISVATLQAIKVPVFIWTGDVRHPVPSFLRELSQYATILFSNDTDTQSIPNSRFLNVGFQHTETIPSGGVIPSSDIVFMGSNYRGSFPLSNYRVEVVNKLRQRYNNNFTVYGASWGAGVKNTGNNYALINKIYRGCKIGINLSHFDYDRYTSDRIFRIMGSGTFCLSHHYKGIEKDFTIGKHLDTFTDANDMVEKINYYLREDSERNKIAKAGCIEVHKKHTWDYRVKQICEIYKSMQVT